MNDRRATVAVLVGAGAIGVAAVASLGRSRHRDVTENRTGASRTLTIRADARTLHELWKSEDTLPEIFRGERNVEITADEPGKLLEWRNVKQIPFAGGGALRFSDAPGGRGTEARLSVYLEGPGSRTASAFRRLFGGSVEQIAMESLRQFKALAEAGEIPRAVRS